MVMLRRPSTFAVTKSLIVLISYLPALHSRPTNGFHVFYRMMMGFQRKIQAVRRSGGNLELVLLSCSLGGVFSGTSPTIMSCLFRIDIGIVESG